MRPLGSVIFIGCEDDAADTVRPRLDAAEADARRAHIRANSVSCNSGTIDQHGLAQEFDTNTADFVSEVNDYFQFRQAPTPSLVQGDALLQEIEAARHPWDDLGT